MKLTYKHKRKLASIRSQFRKNMAHFFSVSTLYLEQANLNMKIKTHQILDSLENPKHEIKDELGRISSVLNRKNQGFTIDGRLKMSKELSRRGVLGIGKTGSSKTVGLILPSLFNIDPNSSALVHDPSGELFSLTSGYFQSLGFDVILIDFTDAEKSNGFNPLFRLHSKAEYNAFAHTIISNQVKGKMDFWSSKAISILVFLIELQKELPSQYDTLYNLYQFVERLQSEIDRDSFDKLVVTLSENKPELFATYSSIVSMSENTLSGVLSTLSTALSIYGLDEDLEQITSKDTLGNFSDFRTKSTIVFIKSSTTKMEYYSPISTLFFNQYFDTFFKVLPSDDELDVLFVLDEMPVIRINSLDIISANIRKYRGNLLCVVQAKSQIINTFGKEKAHTITSNLTTHVYLSIDLEEATQLEKELGTYTYEKENTKQTITRPLQTKTELMALQSQGKGIVTLSGKRPLLITFTPYFKTPSMLRKSKISYQPKTEFESKPLNKVEALRFSIDEFINQCSIHKNSENGQD